MAGWKKCRLLKFMLKVLFLIIVLHGSPLRETGLIPSEDSSNFKNSLKRFLDYFQPQEVFAAAPEINSSDDFFGNKNQPLGRDEIFDGTGWYDPSGNPVIYQWFGPFPTTYGPTPLVYLPEGTHTISLIVHEGADWYNAGTASASITPC